MRVCNNSLRSLLKSKSKKYKIVELKDRIMRLEKEVDRLYEAMRAQEHRIIQLEIARKLGN